MVRVLIVHHTPSPAVQQLLEAATAGAQTAAAELGADLDLVVRPALSAGAADLLAAAAVVLGTPANIGYMSGALKHFFDTIYYPCLTATEGLPFSGYVHGNDSTEGAIKSILKITDALRWRAVRPLLSVTGAPDRDAVAACRELGELAVAAACGM